MYERIVLPNGARVVCEHMDGVRSASLGIWVGAGSRYEKYSEAGSAHFIEHMLFKGTGQYTAAQLAERMDAVGGQMNAYTTRDNTCFYARVLDSHLPLATDTLCSMFFDSKFDEADVENEKGIIQEEIDMYEDTPEDVAAERLLAGCFPGALGRPVLGRAASLRRMTGGSLRGFMARHYTAPRVVAALSGSFADSDVEELVRRFSAMPASMPERPNASAYRPCLTLRKKATEQNQLVLGFPGLETASSERFALQLLSGILGGNASSRLFQTLREKYGLCYSVYSFTAGFEDTGLFAIAAATNRETEERALRVIMDELHRFLDGGASEDELSRAREQVKATILMGLESTSARMNRLGFGELFLGGALAPDELIERYDAVTGEELLALARRLLAAETMSFSAAGRVAGEEKYSSILGLERRA